MRFVLDTNVVIYLQRGMLAEQLPIGEYIISFITEIELLSYASLNQEQLTKLHELFAAVEIVGINPVIKQYAIDLRKNYKLKLPDALIVATSLSMNAELLSNDLQLAQVPNLRCRALRLRG